VLIISFIVGLAVAGLTNYTATSELYGDKRKVARIGHPERGRVHQRLSPSRRLRTEPRNRATLLPESVLGLTVIVAPFAQQSVPQFVVFVRWQDICAVALARLGHVVAGSVYTSQNVDQH
jgi:hypothetical protein